MTRSRSNPSSRSINENGRSNPIAQASLTRSPLSDTPCPMCMRARERYLIREEQIQRLPQGAWAPLSRTSHEKCCFDCAAADTLVRLHQILDWEQARTAVGNERSEQYRAPGMPMGLVALGYVRPSRPGDLEEQMEWIEKTFGPPSTCGSLHE